MNRNLESIAIGAARECIRQGVDEHALVNLLSAHDHTYALWQGHLRPSFESILTLGRMVEPEVNRNGFRRTPVTFANQTSEPTNWMEIPFALARLVTEGVRATPSEYAKAFLDIHPFLDGNGRVAWLLFNWQGGVLDDPLPLPEFYPVAS
jgi:hypothetical protein